MEQFRKAVNKDSKVKKVIAIMSGKGGVGKSFITSTLACMMQRKGYQCAILDADITGPSIPQSFGIHERTYATSKGIEPARTHDGIKIMSMNILLEQENQPVIWRGSVVSDMVRQFWTDVYWGDIDYMFVDMPPGTGDVPLTVFQTLPVDDVIVVTSPQDLVKMIVEKAVNMTKSVDIPVTGIVENMSYFICDQCEKKHYIFGESHVKEIADAYNIQNVVQLPIDPNIALKVDKGLVEDIDIEALDTIINSIEKE